MSETEEGSVSSFTHSGIATIRFEHPRQNALPSAQLLQLAAAINAAGEDPAVRVIVIKSGGQGAFCAGASFHELLEIQNEAAGTEFFLGFARVINACRKSSRIILARVHGKAVGGGLGLAAAADYCIASQAAAIRLSELAIGIGPFVIAPALIRKMGLSAFSALSIRASDFHDALWAQAQGLYQEVLPGERELDASVDRLSARLATYHPEALTALKRVFWEGTENWDELLAGRAAISGRLVCSDFTQQALRSFLSGNR